MSDKEIDEKQKNAVKKANKEELDTETTFADMNVEGMPWYNPNRKNGKKGEKIRLTAKEKWAMFKAGVSVLVPYVLIIAVVFLLMYLLAYFWLS